MSDAVKSKLSPQDKAERTTQAANTIMSEERRASDAKVARLKALRLANQPETEPAKTKPTVRRPKPAARSLALQESPPARKRK